MQLQGYHLLAELSLLRIHNPPGVIVFPNQENILKWLGLISVRSGYYFGGIFHFSVEFPVDFPSKEIPKIYMPKGFYHPSVDPNTGEVGMSTAFPQWNPEKHHVWHMLHYLRRILTSPTSCMVSVTDRIYNKQSTAEFPFVNHEAAETLMHDHSVFEKKAKKCVVSLSVWTSKHPSNSSFSAKPHILNIEGWEDDNIVDHAKQNIRNFDDPNNRSLCDSRGFSWINPETMAVFSTREIDSDNTNI